MGSWTFQLIAWASDVMSHNVIQYDQVAEVNHANVTLENNIGPSSTELSSFDTSSVTSHNNHKMELDFLLSSG